MLMKTFSGKKFKCNPFSILFYVYEKPNKKRPISSFKMPLLYILEQVSQNMRKWISQSSKYLMSRKRKGNEASKKVGFWSPSTWFEKKEVFFFLLLCSPSNMAISYTWSNSILRMKAKCICTISTLGVFNVKAINWRKG